MGSMATGTVCEMEENWAWIYILRQFGKVVTLLCLNIEREREREREK